MLQLNGKTFLNLQEAVQWLLDNNALPFQSSANYVANTEIGMGTIVNPSPAKVRIGSLIFFADSKVSTVIGLTENGFICSDQYNNLVDDVPYVTGVSINASGHLITTLSDGQTIDAGIIKQVASFSINGSQHLIATYNDGSTNDLGAIFSGNITVSGNLTVTNSVSAGSVGADSIIENMTGYSASLFSTTGITLENIYTGAVKNGNKLTFVAFFAITKSAGASNEHKVITFTIPWAVGNKLYPFLLGTYNILDHRYIEAFSNIATSVTVPAYIGKTTNTSIYLSLKSGDLVAETKYLIRYEATFLLSDNLVE